MRVIVFVAIAVPATAWADPAPPAVEVVPVVVQPVVRVEPWWDLGPVHITDLSIGYRHEELGDGRADGAALRVVWGRPDAGFEVEWMPSAAWGTSDDGDSVAHIELSLGLRYVLNKAGHVRPFVIAAPIFAASETTVDQMSTWAYGVGGNAGLGLDIDLPSPGAISVDVRAGQTVDLASSQPSGWQVLATASIGLHVPRSVQLATPP